jgi:HSP20 family protein
VKPAFDATRELAALRERMNRLFDESMASEREGLSASWVPPADVYRLRDRLVVAIELPGLDANSVEVEARPGILVVRGQRPAEPTEGRVALQLERSYGAFERSFTLPAPALVAERRVRMEDGVLRIEIPIGDA